MGRTVKGLILIGACMLLWGLALDAFDRLANAYWREQRDAQRAGP